MLRLTKPDPTRRGAMRPVSPTPQCRVIPAKAGTYPLTLLPAAHLYLIASKRVEI